MTRSLHSEQLVSHLETAEGGPLVALEEVNSLACVPALQNGIRGEMGDISHRPGGGAGNHRTDIRVDLFISARWKPGLKGNLKQRVCIVRVAIPHRAGQEFPDLNKVRGNWMLLAQLQVVANPTTGQVCRRHGTA